MHCMYIYIQYIYTIIMYTSCILLYTTVEYHLSSIIYMTTHIYKVYTKPLSAHFSKLTFSPNENKIYDIFSYCCYIFLPL